MSTPIPEALARRSDPVSSHLANLWIAQDVSLQDRITNAAIRFWSDAHDGQRASAAWTDTEMWRHLEMITGQRLQRNVIARARQLMMDTDRHPNPKALIRPCGLFEFEGRPMLHFILAAADDLDRVTSC